MKKYLLIWVYRGIIQDPEVFQNRNDAESRMQSIKEDSFNPDYDELEIFEMIM
ncbi:MAG: hypothetical protein ACOC2K_02850 [Bacteroidota bacterium]